MTSHSDGITIEISQKPPNSGYGLGSITYGGDSNQQVKLIKEENPTNSGFWKFTHTKNGISQGDSFKVGKVQYESSDISLPDIGMDSNSEIQHLAVWCWSGDDNMKKPLLIELLYKNDNYKYYSSNGDSDNLSWESLISSSQLKGKTLEKELDGLTCEKHNAVTMYLRKINYKTHIRGKKKYCCSKHKGKEKNKSPGKVTVTPVEIYCQTHPNNPTPVTCYKHEINSGAKLSGIRFYHNGNSKIRGRIKSPIPDVKAVHTFYCGTNPTLIYIEGGTQAIQDRWFKKNASKDNIEWTEVKDLQDIIPNVLSNNTKCETYKQLINALSCHKYQQCSDNPQSPSIGQGLDVLRKSEEHDTDSSDSEAEWDSEGEGSSGLGITIGSSSASILGTGGGAYAGWHVYQKYFLDVVVRLI
ncbi:hypothetical protein BEWA_047670 [Theileria equi strain WA]|uniref:Uncharacterized protein n=1 Tax=Theileria equi strain WA TaxID=1537102 RepID=L1LA42_THEEQ|nr:hypothetical protein BEWA_047670 [Theileria equi strain WA]EKX72302.1 hypothetical protein BEWA_047670 [Theileria equi strain WA]|eukprot:XP_004831754.1 hypothetical protein BEWA_047670 [Theileria equi strain WA]